MAAIGDHHDLLKDLPIARDLVVEPGHRVSFRLDLISSGMAIENNYIGFACPRTKFGHHRSGSEAMAP
jgi:hypothetical protein